MNDWLNLLQGASFVAVLLSGTWIGLQRGQIANANKSIEGLRGDRDDLNARLEQRDEKHAEQLLERDAQLAAANARLVDLEAEVSALRKTVTGEIHLTVIEGLIRDVATALGTHHTEAMTNVAQVLERQSDLVAAVRELRAAS